jgi:hypothetical protein
MLAFVGIFIEVCWMEKGPIIEVELDIFLEFI